MKPWLPTPGGVVRWIIRDMRRNPDAWESQSSDGYRYVRKLVGVNGELIVWHGVVTWCYRERAPNDRDYVRSLSFAPGRVRRWRLCNAIARLAARKISEVLP